MIYANGSDTLCLSLKELPERLDIRYIIPLAETIGEGRLIEYREDKEIETRFSHREEIKKYNDAITENVELVNQHNSQLLIQDRIRKNYTEITFSVENCGMVKANDLHVEIRFPEQILVFFELPEKKEIIRPEQIPPHPFDFPISHLMPKSGLQFFGRNSDIVMARFGVKPRNYHVEANSLHIDINSLLHTRLKEIDEPVYIVPLEKGTFSAQVTFICEELISPIIREFAIVVE